MKTNVGGIDKILRIVVGLALVVWALVGGGPVWAWIGVVPLATAAIGVCPAYLPFGMGPRVCMGAAFALQEAALILSSLIKHYRLTPVAGHTPQPVGRLTIRSANGVRLQLHRREAAC